MGTLDLFVQSFSCASVLGAVVVLLLLCLISSSGFSSQTHRKEPPGPRPLPLLGNLLQLDLKRAYHSLQEPSKKYGSVFTIYLGPKKVVVLAGYKAVKEALVNHAEEFGDRDPFMIMDETNQGNGIVWSNGDSWKEMRRFALMNLKDFGMGRKAIEDNIVEECHHLIEQFKKSKGESFETSQPLFHTVSNIICTMVFGSRFEYDDPVFMTLVNENPARLLNTPSIQIYNMFPRFFKWIANRKTYHTMFDANKKLTWELLSGLKETLNPQMCRGLVDAFLVRKQHMEESGITNSHFHDENLITSVMNLFSAGTETTATTLRWGLLFMTKYPKIQDQVQEEISRVIGNRQVLSEDRKNLPFTNAVVHETQRVANIAPTSLPHKTSQEVTFQGYFIKKGTTVYPLLTSVLYDEKEWKNPDTFYPAHFLDNDGKFVKRDAFMPFSTGVRACPGESLARMELFIFFTTLLQNFRFTCPPGLSEDDLDLTPQLKLSLEPLPYKLCAVSRM